MRKTNKLSLILTLLFSVVFLAGIVSAATTQGQFAVKLAENLGLGKNIEQEKAVDLLYSLGIIPGVSPTAKWEKDKAATDVFIAHIQASIQIILKRVANELNIPAPPTLELNIIELPPAPQTVIFPPKKDTGEKTDSQPPTDMPDAPDIPTFPGVSQ